VRLAPQMPPVTPPLRLLSTKYSPGAQALRSQRVDLPVHQELSPPDVDRIAHVRCAGLENGGP